MARCMMFFPPVFVLIAISTKRSLFRVNIETILFPPGSRSRSPAQQPEQRPATAPVLRTNSFSLGPLPPAFGPASLQKIGADSDPDEKKSRSRSESPQDLRARVQQANQQIEKMQQELDDAVKEAEMTKTDADRSREPSVSPRAINSAGNAGRRERSRSPLGGISPMASWTAAAAAASYNGTSSSPLLGSTDLITHNLRTVEHRTVDHENDAVVNGRAAGNVPQGGTKSGQTNGTTADSDVPPVSAPAFPNLPAPHGSSPPRAGSPRSGSPRGGSPRGGSPRSGSPRGGSPRGGSPTISPRPSMTTARNGGFPQSAWDQGDTSLTPKRDTSLSLTPPEEFRQSLDELPGSHEVDELAHELHRLDAVNAALERENSALRSLEHSQRASKENSPGHLLSSGGAAGVHDQSSQIMWSG